MGIVGYPSGYGEWSNPDWNYRFAGISGLGQNYTMNFQQWMQQNPQCVGPNGIICPMPSYVNPSAYTGIAQTGSPLNFVSPAVHNLANNPTMITAGVNDAPGLTAQTGDLASHLAQQVTYMLADPANAGDPTQNLQSVATMYCNLYGNIPGGGDIGCGNMSALVAQYAAEANKSLQAAHVSVQPTSPTNPAVTSNAIQKTTPTIQRNPAVQNVTQSGNAIQPVTYSYSGSLATGQTVLNPANTVNAINTDMVANTGSGGGPAANSGSTQWVWIVAIGAGLLLLMTSMGGKA